MPKSPTIHWNPPQTKGIAACGRKLAHIEHRTDPKDVTSAVGQRLTGRRSGTSRLRGGSDCPLSTSREDHPATRHMDLHQMPPALPRHRNQIPLLQRRSDGGEVNRPDLHGAHYRYRTRPAVLIRDRYICHICHKPIDPNLKHPHPMSATVDHIIGAATRNDSRYLRAAHRICNLKQGDPTRSGDPKPVSRTRW